MGIPLSPQSALKAQDNNLLSQVWLWLSCNTYFPPLTLNEKGWSLAVLVFWVLPSQPRWKYWLKHLGIYWICSFSDVWKMFCPAWLIQCYKLQCLLEQPPKVQMLCHTSFVKRPASEITGRQNTNFKALVLTPYLTLGLKRLLSLEFTSPCPSGEDSTRCHSWSWLACFSIFLLEEPIWQCELHWQTALHGSSSEVLQLHHGLFTALGHCGMGKSKRKLLNKKVSAVLFHHKG